MLALQQRAGNGVVRRLLTLPPRGTSRDAPLVVQRQVTLGLLPAQEAITDLDTAEHYAYDGAVNHMGEALPTVVHRYESQDPAIGRIWFKINVDLDHGTITSLAADLGQLAALINAVHTRTEKATRGSSSTKSESVPSSEGSRHADTVGKMKTLLAEIRTAQKTGGASTVEIQQFLEQKDALVGTGQHHRKRNVTLGQIAGDLEAAIDKLSSS